MRLRRSAGLLAGALVAGSMSIPLLASSASAAPSSVTVTRDYSCAFGNFALPYTVASTVTADGTAVTATLGDMAASNFPTALRVTGFKASVGLDLGGEAVTLTGENTYATPVAGGGPGSTVTLELPDLTGTRTETDDLTAGKVTSLGLVMKAGFGGPATDNPLTCTVVTSNVTVTEDYTCAFGNFALPYAVTSTVTADGAEITATMGDMAGANFPTALRVSGFKANVGLNLNGEAVTLTGENTYPTPVAGGGPGTAVALELPDLTGTRTGSGALTAGSITSLGLVMKAGFGGPATDNPLTCTVAPDATTTTLVATSPAAGAVNLAATVAPAAAGKVEFREGAAVVGEQAVSGSTAALSLTGVSAGEHSYTATFVPGPDSEFAGSTSAVVKVTVAAPGPSATCVKAQDAAKSALAGVTKANATVKKANAQVKKATAKVKKAKAVVKKAKAKAQKAKAKKKLKAATTKLKKVKATAKKSKKALATAKSKHSAAAAAAKKAC